MSLQDKETPPRQSRNVGGRPIARLLPLVLGGLVVIAVLPVLILGYIGAEDNTSRLLRDRNEMIINNVVYRISAHLEPPRQQIRYVQSAVEKGSFDIDYYDEKELGTFLLGALAATPQVTGIGHILPNRSMRRYDRGDVATYHEEASRVPNVDESLAKAFANKDARWLSAVWSPILSETILRLVAPLRNPEGDFTGAIVAAITTSDLSRYLKGLNEEGGPMAYILSGQDHVVAHPFMADRPAALKTNQDAPLPRIDAIGDPVLAGMWSGERFPLTALASFKEADGHWTWIGDETYVFVYRTITGYGDRPWTVGVYFPGATTRRERWIVHGIAIGGFALLCLAIVAATMIGRRLGRPILELASAAERIEARDFDSVTNLPRGPIREVNWAASAFERLAVGLKLFETYVPEAVAQRLIATRGDLPAEERNGTVLFADIEKFTGLAESTPPERMVETLNAYFDAMAKIITQHGGVIDQFQGDGLLATFNIPVALPDHAKAAIQAACGMQQAVRDQAFAGQELKIRIGINTGRILGGSVGAGGRLNYTVHGDAVNVAARVETMNKDYATRILLTESTAEQAGDVEQLRRVGSAAIRGRSKPVTLFTVASLRGDPPREF